jgi:hypothetical protein
MYAKGRLKSTAGGQLFVRDMAEAGWALFPRYFAGPKPGLRRVLLFDCTANRRTPA